MVTRAQALRRSAVLFGLCCCLTACKPELEGRSSLVQTDRILGVRSLPAEAKPNSDVQYEALFVNRDGEQSGDVLDWALCNQRKALTQSGTISKNCLFLEAPALDLLGEGSSTLATLPRDACETFGPTPRTPLPGQPNFRPVDPDTTGGYYQPVRVLARAEQQIFAAGMTRLACGLGGATQEQAADFNRRYRFNENPKLSAVTLVHADGLEEAFPDALAAVPALSVARDERVQLRASWVDCPVEPSCGDGICSPAETDCPADCRDPHGCTGAEPYVQFDPLARRIAERREAMRISWFATGGEFESERTGQAESEQPETSSVNLWTAPFDGRDIWLWVVIRDDRGGTSWSSYRLRVN
ncbi:MAG: hypothetical protein RL701_3540 [Pseudomonadota bacterium]|jgi:hypothetical protein